MTCGSGAVPVCGSVCSMSALAGSSSRSCTWASKASHAATGSSAADGAGVKVTGAPPPSMPGSQVVR